MPLTDNKITEFLKKVVDLTDTPSENMAPADIKAWFDSSPEELRVKLNKVIDDLLSTAAGASGAKQIGVETISGLTGNDVQTLLQALKTITDNKTDKTGNHEGKWQGLLPGEASEAINGGRLDVVEEQLADIGYNISNFPRLAPEVDDTGRIQRLFDAAGEKGTVILEKGNIYNISGKVAAKSLYIVGNGAKIQSSHVGNAMEFKGVLKGTKTVTVDYIKGDTKITLSDVTNVTVGDILNISSTEQYDTSRTYYKKGANVLVTKINGNEVSLSMPIPFSMLSSSLTVNVYDPSVMFIDNLEVLHSGSLPDGDKGISIQYSKNSYLNKVKVDNFVNNIEILGSVNPWLNFVDTKRSFYDGTTTSYGVVNSSCTNLKITNSTLGSGRHGYTSGGEQVVFGTYIENSSISCEIAGVGFDSHANCYDMEVVNCNLVNIGVTGNVTFRKCKISDGGYGYHNLGASESFENANYKFEDCSFLGSGIIRSTADAQVATTTRKYIGNVTFVNCQGVGAIQFNINNILGTPVTGEVNKVLVENSDGCYIGSDDNIGLIIFGNGDTNKDVNFLSQYSTKGKINTIILKNCGIPNGYKAINLLNFDTFTITGSRLLEVGDASGSFYFDCPTGKVNVLNTNLSTFGRGFEVINGLAELIANNSPILFRSTSASLITKLKGNLFESFGSITKSTDSGGTFTITHGLPLTPNYVNMKIDGDNNYNVRIIGKSGSLITVKVMDGTNLVPFTSITLSWEAKI
jgi:hypothetical protein